MSSLRKRKSSNTFDKAKNERPSSDASFREEGQEESYSIKTRIYFVLIVICFSFFTNINTFQHPFIFDDDLTVVKNPDVRPEVESSAIWNSDYWGGDISSPLSHKSYRPLTVLTFKWNVWMFGFDPYPFHVTNVLLHVITSVLMYVASLLCLQKEWSALFAGVLFAVHPIHTECVANISGRAEILCAMFYLAAFIAYSVFCKTNNWIFFISTVILWILSTLSKEGGFTLLVILIAYDFAFGPTFASFTSLLTSLSSPSSSSSSSSSSKSASSSSPSSTTSSLSSSSNKSESATSTATKWISFVESKETKQFILRSVCLSIVFFYLVFSRMLIIGNTELLSKMFAVDNRVTIVSSWMIRTMTYAYLHFYNALIIFLPFQLSADYSYNCIPFVTSITDIRNIFSATLYASIALTFWNTFKMKTTDGRTCLIGLVFLIFPFIPASNILLSVGFVAAERVLYTPSIGACILFAFVMEQSLERFPNNRKLLKFIAIALVIIFSIKTIIRNSEWNNEISLWKSALEVCPNSAKARNNYANALILQKRHEEALPHIEASLKIDPEEYITHILHGLVKREKKLWNEAAESHRIAALLQPTNVKVLLEYAKSLELAGRKAEADAIVARARQVEPTWLYDKSRAPDAPIKDEEYYLSTSGALLNSNNAHQAIAILLEGHQLHPHSLKVLNNLAAAYLRIGDHNASLNAYMKLIEVGERSPSSDAKIALARAYFAVGHIHDLKKEINRSVMFYRKSIRSDKTYAKPYFALSVLYLQKGMITASVEMMLEGCKLDAELINTQSEWSSQFKFLVRTELLVVVKTSPLVLSYGPHYQVHLSYNQKRKEIDGSTGEVTKALDGISRLKKGDLKLGLDDVFLLNLDSRPDRLEDMAKLAKSHNFSFSRFPAIDGLGINLEKYKKNGFISSNLKITRGEVACALSHRAMYQKIVTNQLRHVLILEDDVDVDANFVGRFVHYFGQLNAADNDWDIFYVGGNLSFLWEDLPKDCYDGVSENIIRLKTFAHFGFYGYVLSARGAQKLLDITASLSKPIDMQVASHYSQLKAYAAKPPLVHHPGLLSDTQKIT